MIILQEGVPSRSQDSFWGSTMFPVGASCCETTRASSYYRAWPRWAASVSGSLTILFHVIWKCQLHMTWASDYLAANPQNPFRAIFYSLEHWCADRLEQNYSREVELLLNRLSLLGTGTCFLKTSTQVNFKCSRF